MKQKLRELYFRLRGKDPEAVVLTFATGPAELTARMFAEIQDLVPDRRHFLVESEEHLRRRFRGYRIGQAAVLFTGEPQFRKLRRAAFLLAPAKILAYNARLERHHLRLRTWIGSLLFLRGTPLDRIFLRPSWLFPWKKDRSIYPAGHRAIEGRPFRAGRKRLGIVSPYVPYPLAHGGAVRIYNLLREIAREFDVVLFAFHDQETEADLAALLEYCAHLVLVPKTRYREPRWATFAPPEVCEFDSPAMHRAIQRAKGELKLDAVQVEYTTLARNRGDILVAHDLTFDLYRQVHDRERSLKSWWDYWRWRRFERRWIARYRRVVVMSEQDQDMLASTKKLVVIPNGVDLDRFTPEPERSTERLLFVGSFRHFPNIVAYRFFVEKVSPSLPGVRLTVVAGPDPRIYWREHTGSNEIPTADGIELLGFVRDVRPLYVDATLVIVPTLVSAGTNLKVLEALAMERAVVSTTSGCAGLGLEHGTNVWIAGSPEEFADAIRRLLHDPGLRRSIAAAGRTHVEQHFDWRQIGLQQRRLIRALAGTPIQLRPAESCDIDAIWAIQSASLEASQWHRDDYFAFDCNVAQVDGRIAGFLVSRALVPGEREILNIAVDPEYRRLGIAQELIRAEVLRNRGIHILEVRESNLAARALYRKMGFREVGLRPGYYENPVETGIVMRFLS